MKEASKINLLISPTLLETAKRLAEWEEQLTN